MSLGIGFRFACHYWVQVVWPIVGLRFLDFGFGLQVRVQSSGSRVYSAMQHVQCTRYPGCRVAPLRALVTRAGHLGHGLQKGKVCMI